VKNLMIIQKILTIYVKENWQLVLHILHKKLALIIQVLKGFKKNGDKLFITYLKWAAVTLEQAVIIYSAQAGPVKLTPVSQEQSILVEVLNNYLTTITMVLSQKLCLTM